MNVPIFFSGRGIKSRTNLFHFDVFFLTNDEQKYLVFYVFEIPRV
jgi:hypothetical protein